MNCENCGAPADGKILLCTYCQKPVSAELMRTAIACPQCRTPNLAGSQRCSRCQAWVVVQCVFCSALSAYTEPACRSCHEPFAGAIQRKAARDAEIARQQQMQMISTVGSVAAPFLGAVAGSLLEGVFSHHGPSHFPGGAVNGDVFSGDAAPFGHIPHGHGEGGSVVSEAASAIFDDKGSGDSSTIGDITSALFGGSGGSDDS